MRASLSLLGIALAAFGVLFVLQGAGIVHWPAESFMLGQRVWIWRGLGIAAAGGIVILLSRRF